jgi:hypothetical protein
MKKFLATLAVGVLAVNAFATSQLFINDFDFEYNACYMTYYNDMLACDAWTIEVEGADSFTQMYLVSDFYNEFSITYTGTSDLFIRMYACDGVAIGAEFMLTGIIDDENAHYLWEFADQVLDVIFCDWDCGGPVTEVELPTSYRLSENYPNPFNPTTTIDYDLVSGGNVELTVYNVTGEVVANLVNGHRDAGSYTVTFDAANLASGVYFYRLTAGDFKATHKMTLVK